MRHPVLSPLAYARRSPARALSAALLAAVAAVLAALVCVGLARQFVYDWYTLATPYFVNPMEGREAVKAWMLGVGRSLYPPQPGPSALVTIYPPLYHLLTLGAAQALPDVFFAGRLLSMASTVAVAAVLGAWIRRATGSSAAAVLTGLSFLADPFSQWGAQSRPDMLAHALALGAAYALYTARHARRACWAGLLAALALYAKQQTLPFVLGMALYGLLKGPRERRLTAVFAGALAACAAVPGVLLNGATQGQFFTDIIAYPKRMGESPGIFSVENLESRLKVLWGLTAWKTGLAGCWLVWTAAARRLDLAALLLVVNLPFALRILGTWGADYNYALGVVILGYACVGQLAGRLLRLERGGVLACALVFLAINLDGGRSFTQTVFDNPHQGKWAGVRETLVERLRGVSGPVLVNTEGGQLFLGQGLDDRLDFFDAIELGLFEKAGFWSFADSQLAARLAQRAYSLVVLSNDFLPGDMRGVLKTYYGPPAAVGQYEVYAPRPQDVILAVGSLPDAGTTAGGVNILLRENLKVEPDHVEPQDQGAPAFLTLEATASMDLKELVLGLFPRLNHADGSSLSCTVTSAPDASPGEWTCPVLPGRTWSGVWEMHAQQAFAVRGDTVRIAFRLMGNAQLYFDRAHPMVLSLTRK